MHASSSFLLATAVLSALGASAIPQTDGPSAAPIDEVVNLATVTNLWNLAPGRYAKETMGMLLEFSLDDGWGSDDSVGLVLDKPGNGLGHLDLHDFGGVFYARPCSTSFADENYFEDFITVDATARAFMDQLAANPYLVADEPVALEVDGNPAMRMDLSVDVGEECVDPEGVTFLWFSPAFLDGYHLIDGAHARVVAIDVDDRVLVTVMEADAVDAQDFFEDGMAVLESMSIRPLE